MLSKVFYLVFTLIIAQDCALAQNDGAHTFVIEDRSFSVFFKEYVKKNQLNASTKGVPILVISRRGINDCDVIISMFSLLSQVESNPPNDYGFINNQLVLIYDGTEHMFKKPKIWYISLKKMLQNNLCDNTQLVTHPSQTTVIPCTFKHDPEEWKLTFERGKLVNKQTFVGETF